jgi:hypothetical protein
MGFGCRLFADLIARFLICDQQYYFRQRNDVMDEKCSDYMTRAMMRGLCFFHPPQSTKNLHLNLRLTYTSMIVM